MIYLYFSIYIVLINIIGFLVIYIDKNKAKKGSYRISEKTIFIIAVVLGAIGIYIGMYKFRHKTKHTSFTVGIPVCIVINIFTVYYILSKNLLIILSNYLNLWIKKAPFTHNGIRWFFMDNTITYKRIIIIACIVSILFGVFLHFAYELSGHNAIVGIFAPVNESVWEHLKLIFLPFTLFSIAFYFYTKRKFSNMLLTTLFGNIVGMFVVTTLYYLGDAIFAEDNMVYNIIIYAISVMSSYFILYLGIYSKDFIEETKGSTVIGACALVLLFAIFVTNTFSPIKFDLTRDPVTKTYGIDKRV